MLIRVAYLPSKLFGKDVLLKFSKVYKIAGEKKESLSEIPSSIKKIDRLLGTNIFSKRLQN